MAYVRIRVRRCAIYRYFKSIKDYLEGEGEDDNTHRHRAYHLGEDDDEMRR